LSDIENIKLKIIFHYYSVSFFKNSLILLRKLKITPFSTFLDSLDKNSFINALNLDSVFTKTLECLGGIAIKSLSDIENIKLKIIFHYYSEIVKGYSNIENLSPLIKRLEKRINTQAFL
jgi:hypothetical protein